MFLTFGADAGIEAETTAAEAGVTVAEEVAATIDAETTGTVAVADVPFELVDVGGFRPRKSRSTSLLITGWFNNERSARNP